MTNTTRSGLVLALGIIFGASGAQAQATHLTVGTGFGGVAPVGDLADVAKLGWNAQVNVGVTNPTWPVALRFDGTYSALAGEEVGVAQFGDLRVIAGLANVELYLMRNASGGGLFVVGGGGIYNTKFDASPLDEESATDPGIFGGAGYKIAMTNLKLSIEGKFHNIFTEGSSTQLIPFDIVAEIPIGGGSSAARR